MYGTLTILLQTTSTMPVEESNSSRKYTYFLPDVFPSCFWNNGTQGKTKVQRGSYTEQSVEAEIRERGLIYAANCQSNFPLCS